MTTWVILCLKSAVKPDASHTLSEENYEDHQRSSLVNGAFLYILITHDLCCVLQLS